MAFTLAPAVVDAPLYPGLAIRGLDAVDTRVIFDGFELPALFHGDHALRSILVPDGISAITTARDDVELGGGTSFLSLTPRRDGRTSAQLTDLDFTLSAPDVRHNATFASVRFGSSDGASPYLDGIGIFYRKSRSWEHTLSALSSQSGGRSVTRLVGRSTYRRGIWRASAAISPMLSAGTDIGHRAVDGRVDIQRRKPVGGLRQLTWRAGLETKNWKNIIDHDVWTNDLGAWTAAEAAVSQNIVAKAGVRFDAFLRGNDYATEPRGSVEGNFGPSSIKLAAAAFRRPPQQYFELDHASLHPERTKQFVASASHTQHGISVQVAGFYIDRTRLIAPDDSGVLGNRGSGTSKGLEADCFALRGRWFAYAAASLSSSTVRDFPRGREHPATFDQPLRVDSLVAYTARRFRVVVRYSLSSGLPYMPVIETTYNSDADAYAPVYGFANSERMPWMHRLDIRGDYRFNRHFSGFVDVYNAYAASTSVGYTYSYDYKTRLDTTLPIFPFVGVRGEL